MKVTELIARRQPQWWELTAMCEALNSKGKNALTSKQLLRFAALHRAVCADLALAEAYQFPEDTIQYLQRLVGKAHNLIYRSRTFHIRRWPRILLLEVPQQLLRDPCVHVTFLLFWGVFIASMFLAMNNQEFSDRTVPEETKVQLQEMYAQPLNRTSINEGGFMHGFYIRHNASIGLRCFAWSIVLVGLFMMVFQAVTLGASFGYMATTSARDNFFEFVTAHGPFELTAIILATAAGLRIGLSLVHTGGLSRSESLKIGRNKFLPMAMLAVILFAMAAVIEAYISPSPAPYWMKAGVAILSTALLLFYIVGLGWVKDEEVAT